MLGLGYTADAAGWPASLRACALPEAYWVPMLSLVHLPLYILYSLAGTSAAGLAKASLHAAARRDWSGASLRFAGAIGAISINFSLMLYLLGRADMSVMVPVAVGFNLLTAAAISIWFFRERVDRWKLAGMLLIGAGVVLVAGG
jgi:multidrug transporter EmrE-like cation transporter